MTTRINRQKSPTRNLGRYRHLVESPGSGTTNPFAGNGSTPLAGGEAFLRLEEKVAGLENWRMSTATDLKAVLEVIQQARVLMALSICGGGLAIVSLVMTVVSMIERNF